MPNTIETRVTQAIIAKLSESPGYTQFLLDYLILPALGEHRHNVEQAKQFVTDRMTATFRLAVENTRPGLLLDAVLTVAADAIVWPTVVDWLFDRFFQVYPLGTE